MNPNIKRALLFTGTILVLSVALTLAKQGGLIDGDTVKRFVMAFIGLGVAWYGNITPKEGGAWSARRQAHRRVAGYAVAGAGLVNTAIWIWAPMSIAAELSMIPLVAAFIVILTYCFWLCGPAAQA